MPQAFKFRLHFA